MEFFASNPNVSEFIMKIYYILEKNQFEDILCWSHNSLEIQIKNTKALEEKVLPLFFRHKKIQSFVRQLNMYNFSKANKLNKDKNHMFFRNNFFRKGQIQLLSEIKRKKKYKQRDCVQNQADDQGSNFQAYKSFIKQKIQEIQDNLNKLKKTHPHLKQEVSRIDNSFYTLLGTDKEVNVTGVKDVASSQDLLKTFKDLICSLNNFDSHCSIQMQMNFNESY